MMRITRIILVCLGLLFIAGFAEAKIIYVDGDNTTGPWDGTQIHPYQYIQDGMDAAVNGDTVLVADGTYTGLGNVILDFQGKAITVKSENGAENCIIDCERIMFTCGFFFQNEETSDSVVDGFTIRNGLRAGGAGITCGFGSSPTITRNIITGNICGPNGKGGGGIYCAEECSATITKNIITGNDGGHRGGGICCRAWSTPTITNNVIAANVSGDGGGIYCADSSPTIINNTITRNLGIYCGGGIYCKSASPVVINTVLWDNKSFWPETPQEICFSPYGSASAITISYSDVQGGEDGIITNDNGIVNWLDGNIDKDPMFVRPAIENYHLLDGSPCINAGTPDGAPPDDIEGFPRDDTPNMGAYEYVVTNDPPVADPDGPYYGEVGGWITFDGSKSYDPNEGSPLHDYIDSWDWDMDGDSEYDDASGETVWWKWDAEYSGPIGLKVTDSFGVSGTSSTQYTTVAPSELWGFMYFFSPYTFPPLVLTLEGWTIIMTVWEVVLLENKVGRDAYNVTAVLVDDPAYVPVYLTILDGDVSFGDISAGVSKFSDDDFSVRVVFGIPFPSPRDTVWWIIEWDDAEGHHSAMREKIIPIYGPLGTQVVSDLVQSLASGQSSIAAIQSYINPGQVVVHSISVPPQADWVKFALFWPGSDMDLVLIKPDGTEVTPSTAATDPDVDYTKSDTNASYGINNPMSGEWLARITAIDVPADGCQYYLNVAIESDISTNFLIFEPSHEPGDPIVISLSLRERVGDFWEPVLGCTVDVAVTRPDASIDGLTLNDDGFDGDDETNDGIYSATYANTGLAGSYLITADASGTAAFGPFSSQAKKMVQVGDSAQQISIDPASLKPAPDSRIESAQPLISAVVIGPNAYIDSGSIKLKVDGGMVAHSYDNINQIVFYTPPVPFAHGSHSVDLALQDTSGNAISASWSFTISLMIEVAIYLNSGWNLISLPLEPMDTEPSVLLYSINTKLNSVWTYDSDAGWSVYVPNGPSNLGKMARGKGYWIEMNQPGTLVIHGTDPGPEPISLKGGKWNLVGHNALLPQPIGNITPTMPDGTCIYTYDGEEETWSKYFKGGPSFLNDLDGLEPGKGYFIYVEQDWIINY